MLLVAVTLSACSGAGSSGSPQWPADLRSNVVNTCMEAGGSAGRCNCETKYLEANFSPAAAAGLWQLVNTAMRHCANQ